MLVGDKAHRNFEIKENRDVVGAHRWFCPCTAVAMRGQKCSRGTLRLTFLMNESRKLDTQWE